MNTIELEQAITDLAEAARLLGYARTHYKDEP